jgi:hypothetical protein
VLLLIIITTTNNCAVGTVISAFPRLFSTPALLGYVSELTGAISFKCFPSTFRFDDGEVPVVFSAISATPIFVNKSEFFSFANGFAIMSAIEPYRPCDNI